MSKKLHVAVNEHGRRIGESHPRAKLTDHEVDLMRELFDELTAAPPRGRGLKPMAAYREIAEKFETKTRYAQKIVLCEKRAHTIAGHRRVR